MKIVNMNGEYVSDGSGCARHARRKGSALSSTEALALNAVELVELLGPEIAARVAAYEAGTLSV